MPKPPLSPPIGPRSPILSGFALGRAHAPITDTGGGGGGAYVAKAVHFDGATALYRSTALAGVTDSPVGICSMWLKYTPIDVGDQSIVTPWCQCGSITDEGFPNYNNTLSQTSLRHNANQLTPFATSAEIYLTTADYASDMDYTPNPWTGFDGAWHHILYAWDTNHVSGERITQVAIDGVLATTLIRFEDGDQFDASCSAPGTTIGAEGWDILGGGAGGPSAGPVLPYTGDMADLYINFSATRDLTTQANIDLFVASGKPTDPTTFPAGAAILLAGDATGFATNQATGGAFTLTGTLTNATTSPSD